MIKGLLIDLDGTLVDTHPFLFTVFSHFLGHFGETPSEETFHELIGPSLEEIVSILKERYQLKPSQKELYELYRSMLETGGGMLMPGVEQFLEFAKTEKLKLGVVTSGPRPWAENLLTKLNIRDHFLFIVSASEAGRGKPAPDAYLAGMNQINLMPDELIAVEDSTSGRLAAERAGLTVLDPDWQQVIDHLLESNYPLIFSADELLLKEVAPKEKSLEKENYIDKLWTETLVSKPYLFNGPLMMLSEIKDKTILAYFSDYKHYVAQLVDSQIDAEPLAVVSLTRFKDKILLGRRSQEVSTYRGYWELSPAGSLTSLDYLTEIYQEFHEEIGVAKEQIKSIKFLGLFFDIRLSSYELVFEAELNSDAVKTSKEVSELKWIDPSEISTVQLIPLALRVCRLLNHDRKQNKHLHRT